MDRFNEPQSEIRIEPTLVPEGGYESADGVLNGST